MWVLITAELASSSNRMCSWNSHSSCYHHCPLGMPPAPAMSPKGPRGHAANSAPTQEKARPPSPSVTGLSTKLWPAGLVWAVGGGSSIERLLSNTETRSM